MHERNETISRLRYPTTSDHGGLFQEGAAGGDDVSVAGVFNSNSGPWLGLGRRRVPLVLVQMNVDEMI